MTNPFAPNRIGDIALANRAVGQPHDEAVMHAGPSWQRWLGAVALGTLVMLGLAAAAWVQALATATVLPPTPVLFRRGPGRGTARAG